MTKAELIKVWKETQQEGVRAYSRAELESLFDGLCGIFAAELLGNGDITLPGLGKLTCVRTRERVGRNPKSGEPLTIPAGRTVKFKVFKDMKDALK